MRERHVWIEWQGFAYLVPESSAEHRDGRWTLRVPGLEFPYVASVAPFGRAYLASVRCGTSSIGPAADAGFFSSAARARTWAETRARALFPSRFPVPPLS